MRFVLRGDLECLAIHICFVLRADLECLAIFIYVSFCAVGSYVKVKDMAFETLTANRSMEATITYTDLVLRG